MLNDRLAGLPAVVSAPSIAPGREPSPTPDEMELRRRTADAIRGAYERFETSRGFNKAALVRLAATRAFHMKTYEMVGTARFKRFTVPRQIAMTIAKRIANKGVAEIGHHFGGRDHTTVLHAVRKYSALVDDVLNDMKRGAL
jgi:chromosomal replication initiation ATPase DnaA